MLNLFVRFPLHLLLESLLLLLILLLRLLVIVVVVVVIVILLLFVLLLFFYPCVVFHSYMTLSNASHALRLSVRELKNRKSFLMYV